MTIILSLPHPHMIVMCADSRKTLYITHNAHTGVGFEYAPVGESVEYHTMQKIFPVAGVGCISLWGDVTLVENGFPRFLRANVANTSTIEELRTLVENYLRLELRAEERGEDIGFHVGGFMPDGTPKLYHVFYGWDRPRPEGQIADYHSYDSSHGLILFNGQNGYVAPIVDLLMGLQEQVGISIFNNSPAQRIMVADYVTRYISTFNPEVGGAIHTVLITPKNEMLHIRKPQDGIFVHAELEKLLSSVGIVDNGR